MAFVIVDCGGFKQIMNTERPNSIRKLQDDFRDATIEGDEFGRVKMLTGAEVSRIFNGKSNKVNKVNDILETKVKPVSRRV